MENIHKRDCLRKWEAALINHYKEIRSKITYWKDNCHSIRLPFPHGTIREKGVSFQRNCSATLVGENNRVIWFYQIS